MLSNFLHRCTSCVEVVSLTCPNPLQDSVAAADQDSASGSFGSEESNSASAPQPPGTPATAPLQRTPGGAMAPLRVSKNGDSAGRHDGYSDSGRLSYIPASPTHVRATPQAQVRAAARPPTALPRPHTMPPRQRSVHDSSMTVHNEKRSSGGSRPRSSGPEQAPTQAGVASPRAATANLRLRKASAAQTAEVNPMPMRKRTTFDVGPFTEPVRGDEQVEVRLCSSTPAVWCAALKISPSAAG